MMEIIQCSLSELASSSSSITCVNYDGSHQQLPNDLNQDSLFNTPNPNSYYVAVGYSRGDTEEEGRERKEKREREEEEEEGDQVSLLALLVTVFRKSLIACRSERIIEDLSSSSNSSNSSSKNRMEIGCPTNVRHVAHVTFDRFNGFLGLPDEFEPEVPRRPPSASASVFGVSTESMQLSFDSRGNSVPTILLMMQRRLYSHGGLQAEGIFRINAENSQEEYVREQLNTGVVPHDIDVHCLAGLIKAWFRELPNGILDSVPPEQVMQAQTEEECARLVRLLPPTEAALLDWAINLMADVAQLEHLNKMNARNIAMVFAPNMTQMDDPLTALMFAVQVMNFLKTLIVKTLRERKDSIVEPSPLSHLEPSDENGEDSSSQPILEEKTNESGSNSKTENHGYLTSIENIIHEGSEVPNQFDATMNGLEEGGLNSSNGGTQLNTRRNRTGQSSTPSLKKGPKKVNERTMVRATGPVEKSRGATIVSRINSRTERFEAWR